MAGLHFPITADNRGFMQAIHEITAGVSEATRQIEANGGSIDKVISMIKTGVASIGIGLGFKELIGQVTSTRDEFQKLEIAFKTFLGSEEEANKLMAQMVHTAAITPFDLAGVADGAKNLLAFGVAAEDVNKTIISLGDIAAGLSQPLGDIIYLYGTTIAKPKMDTQDLMQFMGRGIPIAKELAKQFGVAENKVRDLVSAGKVSGDAVKKAFESMTGAGSMFGGLMEAQSKSIGGQIANIEDSIDEMFNAIGKSSEGIINFTLETTSKIVENWQNVLLILGDVAAAYGAQKAILALDAGFTKAATNYGYDAEIEQLKALIPAKEEEAATALQQAVASGNLTAAKAAEIEALREEAEEYLKVLAAKEAEAKQNELNAQAALTTAYQDKSAADEMLETAKEKWQAAYDAADAIAEEAAAQELEIAKTFQSEAADALATATKEAKAASSAHVAAQQQVESASTAINTAQTTGNTAATGILTIAKEKLAVAIGKVNAMLKANQFAIVAGAVIALGYAIYKLITYQTDYQKSLDRLDDSYKSCTQSISKESVEIDRYFGKLKSAKKGTKEWEEARTAIWSKYGDYLKALGDEKTALNDVAKAYELVRSKAVEAAKARAMDKFLESEADSFAQNQADSFDRIYKLIAKKKGENFAAANENAIWDVIEGKRMINPQLLREFDVYTNYTSTYGSSQTVKSNALEAELAKTVNQRNDFNRLTEEAERKYGVNRALIEDNTNGNQDSKTLQDAYDNAKQEYEKAKSEVSKMESNRKAYTQEAYEKAVSDLKSAKEAFEKLGGQTKSKSGPTSAQLLAKEENAVGKLADVMRRQFQERLRMEQDYEHERWQTRIDLMEEGEAKVLAQQKLDFEKERTALQRRKEQEIQSEIQRQKEVFDAQQDVLAAADKKYARKTFNNNLDDESNKDIDRSKIDKIKTLYSQLEADLSLTQSKAEADRLDAAKESMNAYLKEFGSYQQKRLAIEEEYERKIAEAQNEGERLSLIGQRNKTLSDLDYDEWIETGEIALAFGEVQNLSEKTVTRLIADMEKYREKVIATFDPDKIQKYEDALTALRNVESDNSLGVFAGYVPDWFKQRKSVGSQMDSAGSNINALEEKRVKLLEKIARLQDLIEVTGANGNDTSRLAEQLNEANVELADNENATKKAKNVFKQLQEQWDSLNTPEAKFYALCGAISTATGLVGDFASQAAELADAMGAEGLANALGTFADAVDSVGNIANGFAQGGIIGGIAAGVGEVMKWTTKLFQAGDNRKQKNIERLQEQIDALNKSYEKLSRLADDAFSTDASQLIEQQDTLLRQQQALIRQQMMEEESKKKTDSDKIKQYKEQLDEINETLEDNKKKAKEAIIGEDLKSAINEFASLYAEAWNDGTDAAQKSMAAVKSIISSALSEILKKDIQPAATRFYDALAEAMKDGVLTDAELANLDAIKRQMDALAVKSQEQWEMIQSRYKDLDELKEELTDISFDSVRDNFKSLLSDMESTTADFTNSFSDMLRNAMLEGLMNEKYDLMLKEWYDEFADAMNDKTLTDSERDALRQQYDAIVQQGLADRDLINDIVGGGTYSQEASKGGWGAMSQDTADELNGRFTALTELSAIGNTLSAEGNLLSAQILETLRSITGLTMVSDGDNSTIREIRDMMFLSTGHLEDIAKYTKQLYDVNTNLSELRNLIDKRL